MDSVRFTYWKRKDGFDGVHPSSDDINERIGRLAKLGLLSEFLQFDLDIDDEDLLSLNDDISSITDYALKIGRGFCKFCDSSYDNKVDGISPIKRFSELEDEILNLRLDYIKHLLAYTFGNVSAAARLAGCNRKSLYKLIGLYVMSRGRDDMIPYFPDATYKQMVDWYKAPLEYSKKYKKKASRS